MSKPNLKSKQTSPMYHLNRLFLRSIPFFPAPELFDLVQSIQRSKTDLDKQVQEAIDALQKSTELLNKLEQGVQERSEKLAQLRQEYDRYSKLSEIEAEKAEALIEQLQLAIGSDRTRERWIALAINLVAGIIIFLAGVAFNEPIKALFNWIGSFISPLFGI